MKRITSRSLAGFLSLILLYTGCDQNGSGSRLTPANFDQVTIGMSKEQVDKILGPPTKEETKQALLFGGGETRWQPVATCRYEDGQKFIEIIFKDEKVDKKDTNLGREP
jgi:SmpA / OmlA family